MISNPPNDFTLIFSFEAQKGVYSNPDRIDRVKYSLKMSLEFTFVFNFYLSIVEEHMIEHFVIDHSECFATH